jgi:hypothetical protein
VTGLRRAGAYEVLREIDRGAMGVVYLARQPALGRQVALKELVLQDDKPTLAQRFIEESQVAGGLSHPNIVTVFDYFEDAGRAYIAMEYHERGSLRPWLGRLSPAQFAAVFEGLFAGLAHAADAGIIHRDLKPENALVARDGRVVISDFGLAKAFTSVVTRSFETGAGVVLGTPAYMAPEQAQGGAVGPWTDVYAAGVMAYEIATGRVPFEDSDSTLAMLFRKVSETPVPPTALAPDLDPRLGAWIEDMLAPDPRARMQHPADAWARLEPIVVATLGPMWRRHAALGEPAEGAQADRGEPTLPPGRPAGLGSAAGLVAGPMPKAGSPRPGSPGARGSGRRSRRHALTTVRTALVALAVSAVLAVGVLGGGEPDRTGARASSGAGIAFRSIAEGDLARGEIRVPAFPEAVEVGAGAVWVLGVNGTLTRVDPGSGATRTLRVGDVGGGLAVGEGAVWVTTRRGNVLRIDPTSMRKRRIAPPREAFTVAAGHGRVVAASGSRLLVLDPGRNEVRDTYRISGNSPGNFPDNLALGRDAIWIGTRRGVSRVDPSRAAPTERIPVEVTSEFDAVDVAVLGDSVWAAGGKVLSRIGAGAREVTDRIRFRHRISGLATGAGAVWVTSGGSLVVVDRAGRRGLRVPVGRTPGAVAVGMGAVWVVDFDEEVLVRLPLSQLQPQ